MAVIVAWMGPRMNRGFVYEIETGQLREIT
jgi:hypothetical protein